MITVTVKGLQELIRRFGEIPFELKNEIAEAIMKSAFLVEAEAKPVTPVRTGRLRASIMPDYIRPMEAAIAPHTEYAIFVHEGTRYMRPRPFMRWGAERAEPEIQRIFEDVINRVIQ